MHMCWQMLQHPHAATASGVYHRCHEVLLVQAYGMCCSCCCCCTYQLPLALTDDIVRVDTIAGTAGGSSFECIIAILRPFEPWRLYSFMQGSVGVLGTHLVKATVQLLTLKK